MACTRSCACDPSPPHPFSKLLAIQDHAQNLQEQLWMGGGGGSVFYLTDLWLAAIWSKTGCFFVSVSKFLQLVVALYMGGSGVPSSYLIGTMLLESYVPYWSISFNTEDISQEEGRRWPTAKQVSDLMSGFKSIPLAKVTFVSTGNGGVSYSVVKVTTDDWWERWLSWLKRNYKVCTVACVLSLVVLLGYLWSSKD